MSGFHGNFQPSHEARIKIHGTPTCAGFQKFVRGQRAGPQKMVHVVQKPAPNAPNSTAKIYVVIVAQTG